MTTLNPEERSELYEEFEHRERGRRLLPSRMKLHDIFMDFEYPLVQSNSETKIQFEIRKEETESRIPEEDEIPELFDIGLIVKVNKRLNRLMFKCSYS